MKGGRRDDRYRYGCGRFGRRRGALLSPPFTFLASTAATTAAATATTAATTLALLARHRRATGPRLLGLVALARALGVLGTCRVA